MVVSQRGHCSSGGAAVPVAGQRHELGQGSRGDRWARVRVRQLTARARHHVIQPHRLRPRVPPAQRYLGADLRSITHLLGARARATVPNGARGYPVLEGWGIVALCAATLLILSAQSIRSVSTASPATRTRWPAVSIVLVGAFMASLDSFILIVRGPWDSDRPRRLRRRAAMDPGRLPTHLCRLPHHRRLPRRPTRATTHVHHWHDVVHPGLGRVRRVTDGREPGCGTSGRGPGRRTHAPAGLRGDRRRVSAAFAEVVRRIKTRVEAIPLGDDAYASSPPSCGSITVTGSFRVDSQCWTASPNVVMPSADWMKSRICRSKRKDGPTWARNQPRNSCDDLCPGGMTVEADRSPDS
jgi:hypothetical protein